LKISITLPVYNEVVNIERALNGLSRQTYKKIEILVCDDKSTDGTKEVVMRFAQKDPRLQLISNARNLGAEKSFKKLYRMASGELFYGAAADDYLTDNNFFLSAVNALNNNPQAGGCFAKTAVIDRSTGKKLWVMGSSSQSGFLGKSEAKKAFFENKLFVPGTSSVWRKKLIDQVGGYDFKLGPQADYFVNHVIPLKHGAIYLDREVSVMRKSMTSYSSRATNRLFFVRHALFEKKTNAYLEQDAPSSEMWAFWRNSLINARLNIELNRVVYYGIEKSLNIIHEWEKDALAPYLKEIMQIFQRKSHSFNQLIKVQEENAHEIFNRIAGQIDSSSSQATPLRRASFAGQAFKEIRLFLKKLYFDYLH